VASDLQETVLVNPGSGEAGQPIIVTDRVQNNGNAATGAGFRVGFYLSTDNFVSTSDAFLGSRLVSPKAVGALSQVNTHLLIPNVPPGVYYLAAFADDTNAIVETNESNNCAVQQFTVLPVPPPPPAIADLKEIVVVARKLPTGSLIIVDRVQNLGIASTGASFSVGLYLSTDNIITTSDIKIGSRPSPTLAVKGVSQVSTTVSLPPSLSPGTYYVGACADDPDLISESSETNNCKAGGTITIAATTTTTTSTTSTTLVAPDVKEILVIGTKLAGGNLRIIDRVQNIGNTNTGAGFSVAFYLSTTSPVTTSSIQVGNRTSPALAPKAYSQVTTTVPLNLLNLPPGNYYVGACADVPDGLTESNETNNCKTKTGTITLP